ncbi:MAG: DUF4262 domain-containing protein [Vibrio splendidus]
MKHAEFYRDLKKKIDLHDWAHMGIQGCASGDTPFDYTIGLTEMNLPELLICLPIRKEIANMILHNVIEQWKKKGYFVGRSDDILHGMPIELVEIDPIEACEEFMIQVPQYYKISACDVKAVQIVLPDQNGKLPRDDGYNMYQQLLIQTKRG